MRKLEKRRKEKEPRLMNKRKNRKTSKLRVLKLPLPFQLLTQLLLLPPLLVRKPRKLLLRNQNRSNNSRKNLRLLLPQLCLISNRWIFVLAKSSKSGSTPKAPSSTARKLTLATV